MIPSRQVRSHMRTRCSWRSMRFLAWWHPSTAGIESRWARRYRRGRCCMRSCRCSARYRPSMEYTQRRPLASTPIQSGMACSLRGPRQSRTQAGTAGMPSGSSWPRLQVRNCCTRTLRWTESTRCPRIPCTRCLHQSRCRPDRASSSSRSRWPWCRTHTARSLQLRRHSSSNLEGTAGRCHHLASTIQDRTVYTACACGRVELLGHNLRKHKHLGRR